MSYPTRARRSAPTVGAYYRSRESGFTSHFERNGPPDSKSERREAADALQQARKILIDLRSGAGLFERVSFIQRMTLLTALTAEVFPVAVG